VLNVAARHDEALALLESAAAATAAGAESDAYGQTLAAIGMTHAARGTPEAAIQRLEDALATLDGSVHAVTLGGLALALAHAYHAGGRYADSLARAERAIQLVEPSLDDPSALRLRAQAAVRRAAALERLGRTEEARTVLEAAMPRVEAAGDLDNLARAVNNLAYGAQLAGDFPAQQRHQRQALEIAERLGDPARVAVFRAALGQAAFFTNDWNLPESLQMAQEGYRELKELGASWHTAYAAFYLGWILFFLCRLEEARLLLEEAVTLAGNDRQVLRAAQAVLSYADLIQGRPAAAVARLEPLVPADESTDDLDSTLVCAALAHRLAASGERDRAIALGERAVRRARAAGYPLYLLEALFGRGTAAVELGCWERAEADLTEALALARRLGYAAREAGLLGYLARLEAERGNPAAARHLFAGARALCVRLGGEEVTRYLDLMVEQAGLNGAHRSMMG
jgi:tetratricopeptide (TPR) repeat protein